MYNVYLYIFSTFFQSSLSLTKGIHTFAYNIMNDVISMTKSVTFGIPDKNTPSKVDEKILSKLRVLVSTF